MFDGVLNTLLVFSLEFILEKAAKRLGAYIKKVSQIDIMMSRAHAFEVFVFLLSCQF